MSSIHDALKRVRQMDESSPVLPKPPLRELNIIKSRPKVPRILGLFVIVSLAAISVWYILGSRLIIAEPMTNNPPANNSRIITAMVNPVPKIPALSVQKTPPKSTAALPYQAPGPDQLKEADNPETVKTAALAVNKPEPSVDTTSIPAVMTKKTASDGPKPAAIGSSQNQPSPAVLRNTANAAGKSEENPVQTLTRPPKKQPAGKDIKSTALLSSRLKRRIAGYRQAMKSDPGNPLTPLKLGNLFFFELSDLNQARMMYLKVLEIDPDHKLGHNNLGVMFLKQNSFTQAEVEFDAALKIDPGYTDAYYNRACLSAKKGKKSEAMARLLRAAQFDPEVHKWAAGDEDLENLRDMPEFRRFTLNIQTTNEKDE